jgi:hypothetical protein
MSAPRSSGARKDGGGGGPSLNRPWGVLDRYPSLQLIIGHWGGVVLFFLERTAMMQLPDHSAARSDDLDPALTELGIRNVSRA